MAGLLPEDMKDGVTPKPSAPGSGSGSAGSTSAAGMQPPVPPKPSASPAVAKPPVDSRAGAQPPKPPVPPAVAPSKDEPKGKPESGKADGFASPSLRVSLMPADFGDKDAPDIKKRAMIAGAVLLAEVFVLGGFYGALHLRVSAREGEGATVSQRIAALNKEIDVKEQKANEMVTWNAQQRAVTSALDQHVRWTPVFQYLETVTMPGVRYATFRGDAPTHIVAVDATAPSYRAVAEQIVFLRSQPLIKSVRSSAASAKVSEDGTVTGVSFSLTLTLDPSVWKLKEQQ